MRLVGWMCRGPDYLFEDCSVESRVMIELVGVMVDVEIVVGLVLLMYARKEARSPAG